MPGPAFSKKSKVLVLEPYYGGSHRAFLNDLSRWLPIELTFFTLPARKWKWRMRLSAPYYAEILNSLDPDIHSSAFSSVLCSTFVDVAALKGLAPSWFQKLPVLTYFHENQFAYPVQVEDERDFHFSLTNFTTALASDRLAFNSSYNLRTFLEGCEMLLKKSPDSKHSKSLNHIKNKSKVLPPGIDFSKIDATSNMEKGMNPVILWNHRWEHDKNPDRFFETLFTLARQKLDFDVIVLGESFVRKPAIFAKAEQILKERLLYFGYAKSRQEYVRWLKKADLVVSTATHEFYGISVIEAVRAGCRPLLPNRLSYPELFPEEYLYEEHAFPEELRKALAHGRLSPQTAFLLTDRFSWQILSSAYTDWFGTAVAGK